MKVMVEIVNGCVYSVCSEEPCELVVIDRDEMGDETLPDGERGYASIWDARLDAGAVRDAFNLANLHHTHGIAGALLRTIRRVRRRTNP